MDAIERINRALEEWTDSLRGHSGAGGLQPKDVLQRILTVMEDNRIEGLDNKIYVPNQYTVLLHLDDPDERGRLLPFLGKEELGAAIQRYCQRHQYVMRGPLELSIEAAATEAVTEPVSHRSEHPTDRKVEVHCRYDIPETETRSVPANASSSQPSPGRISTEAAQRQTLAEERANESVADTGRDQPAVPADTRSARSIPITTD